MWNLFVKNLEGETEAKFIGMRKTGKQAIIVSLATSQTMPHAIKSHTRNNGHGNALIVSKKFA